MSPLLLGVVLVQVIGAIVISLTSGHLDNIGGPIMGLCATLGLILAVGLGDRGPSSGEKP